MTEFEMRWTKKIFGNTYPGEPTELTKSHFCQFCQSHPRGFARKIMPLPHAQYSSPQQRLCRSSILPSQAGSRWLTAQHQARLGEKPDTALGLTQLRVILNRNPVVLSLVNRIQMRNS